MKQTEIKKRIFTGVVVSDAMNKTVVVKVDRMKNHPKYHKQFLVSKKYKVHDENNVAKNGDKVSFVETRPISKDKRWTLIIK